MLTLMTGENIARFLFGLLTSLQLALVLVLVGGSIGVVLAGLRSLPIRPVRWLVSLFVLYHRNVPLLVQLLFWYFAMPQLFPKPVLNFINSSNPEFLLASAALSFAFGAYVSEDLRSGFRALPKVQYEASRAIGLSFLQSFIHILLPQATRNAMPALINQLLLFFKGTSLASVVGVAELTHVASDLNSSTLLTFETFFVATALYLFISLLIIGAGSFFSDRMSVRT